ncbi:MAG: RidA family protein [Bacteroidota bacterium]
MSKTIINSNNAPAPIGPYSQAVLAGATLYVSGQIPMNAETGELVNSDIAAETKKVMQNIESILSEAGYTFKDVVKCSIFVTDMGNFSTINEVYGTYFKENPPARETVEVSGLPKNVNVEISCIAIK